MKKKFCNFLGVLLAVSLMVPGGAFAAFADEITSTRDTPQLTTEQTQSSSKAKDQEAQEEQAEAATEDEQTIPSEQQVSDENEEQKTNGTRAGPLSEVSASDTSSDNPIAPVSLLRAPTAPQVADVDITRFQIEAPKGNPVTELDKNWSFYLAMDWKIKDSSTVLHKGDYFDITLPDNLKFPPNYSAPEFDLTDSDGNVIAHAKVTPGPDNAGGSVRVTFNDKIENKYNVHGTLYISALFNKQKIQDNKPNTFTVTVNGKAISTDLTPTKKGIPSDELLGKWGERINGADQVIWYARFNYKKANLHNAVVTDSLSGDETYIPGSFRLNKVVLNDEGQATQVLENIDISGKLTLSPDKKSFTLNLGDVAGSQYELAYTTTYKPGTTIRNKIKLTSREESKEITASYATQDNGGTAGGDLASKIKLTKVDEDGITPLKNAVFTVTAPDGSTFELTTGADGTVTSGVLVQGTYKVKEKKAPLGYELGSDEYTLEVTPAGGALKTITNKPIKISVCVKKTWVGPKAGPVTVHLLADGTDTGKTLTLDESNGWKGQFDNLRKYKADGTEIVYTVKEDDVPNYTAEVTGDAATGFTITNTNTEKVNVPVKKEWVGPKAGPVTVHLLADGTDTGKTLTLDESNGWKGQFDNLRKYKADGTEIVYTVKEDDVPNYTAEVTGDAATGFTITNTETPKPKKPSKKVPYTGDAGVLGTVVPLSAGAIALLGTGIYLRKRNK